MKIGIDVRMIEHSGIGTRISHLLKYLQLNPSNHQYFLFGNPDVLENHITNSKQFQIVPYLIPIYHYKEWFGHPMMGEMELLDIPHFNVPIFYLKKCVVTIHDLIPYKMKKYFSAIKRVYLIFLIYLIKRFALKIVSVSDFTKQDLINEFKIKENRIQTIYNGIDQELFRQDLKDSSNFLTKYGLQKDYILTVGIGKEHKNVKFVIESLKVLWKNGKLKNKLVIGGTKGLVPDYLKESIKDIKEFVIFFPHIEFAELPYLYKNAKLFIFPSQYEGFGFPPLEAQSVGCPVLSSNATVLPEVLNNSALYFNPVDSIDFLMQFEFLNENEVLQKELVQKGFVNSKRFNWIESVKGILKLYNEVKP